MAIPVVQSSNTNNGTAVSSLTITKPTGLTVGDLLVVCLGAYTSGGTPTITTPSGWTVERTNSGAGDDTVASVMTKEADSSDVAASDFTFNFGGTVDAAAAYLARVDGFITANPSDKSEIDTAATPSGTSISNTTALTPTTSNTLVIVTFFASDNSITGTPSVSGYASTPSATYTEVADNGTKNGFSDGIFFGVATADYTGTTQITNRQATLSEDATEFAGSIIVLINGPVDASGTHALYSVTPAEFTTSGQSGTSGTSALLTPNTSLLNTNGQATSPTPWTQKEKPSTTWTQST